MDATTIALAEQLRLRQTQTEGTLIGSALGMAASLSENSEIRDRINGRGIAALKEEVEQLKKKAPGELPGILPRLHIRQVADLLSGFASAHVRLCDGAYQAPIRPTPFSAGDAAALAWPPAPSVYDSSGNLVTPGQNWRFGLSLSQPEVQAAVSGLGLPQVPSQDQLRQIFVTWSAFQAAAAQTGVTPALTSAQLAALSAQIAGAPLAAAQLQNVFTAMMSQASQAFNLALAGAGPLNAAQVTALANYFSSLVASIVSTAAGAAAVSTWIAANSPALADPSLDVVWPVTGYNSSSLEASAVYTSAALGALVLGAQATAIVFKYGYNQEQQTARSFRVKITPTTTAGALFSAYLPAALRNLGAPKVHLQVEGIGVVAGGSPYVSAVAGGAQPYFTVTTGTNPAATTAYNIVCHVTD